jgi:3-oxoacyl-[acyl-carrier-protein] synthase II
MRGARRAFITGMGCVGPHGVGIAAFLDGLRAGRTATRALTLFDAGDLPSRVAGQVPDFHPEAHVAARDRQRVARVVPMACLAAREALSTAGLPPGDLPPDVAARLHVLVGSGAGCIEFGERQYAAFYRNGPRAVGPYAVPSATTGMLASEVSLDLGLGGPSHVLSNGCTSSTDALGYALDLVRAGRTDVLLVGGADACITPAVLAGYCALRVVSTAWNEAPERASRPMSADRDGFVLGEGAWMLVVESEDAVRRRRAAPLAEIAGYGSTCEAWHRVAVREDGREPARAMYQALHDAEVAPEDLDYVNLHGTGTPLNDRVETRAMKRVLAERAAAVPMSCTKSLVGHPQGASGAAGVVATVLGMQGGFVPPTANLEVPDPECDLDYVPGAARPQAVRWALCNCLGFGSKNSAVVLRHPDA